MGGVHGAYRAGAKGGVGVGDLDNEIWKGNGNEVLWCERGGEQEGGCVGWVREVV